MKQNRESNIKEKIKRAANELIFTYGSRGWNMDDCAREAGITKRTLYHHISSKEQLVENALKDFIRTTQQNLATALEEEPDFHQGLEKMLKIFPPMIMKLNSRIVQDIFRDFPTIENHLIDERLTLAAEALDFLKKGQTEGYLKKNIDTLHMLEVLQSLVLYYMKNDPDNFEEKLRMSFTLVLHGILDQGR